MSPEFVEANAIYPNQDVKCKVARQRAVDWAVSEGQVASRMVEPSVRYDYRDVLADCGVDVNDDIYAPVSVADVHLQGWRSLVHGGDVAVDVLRVFIQLGRVSVGAQLIAERGLLGEVVLAFGGRAGGWPLPPKEG